MQAHSTVTGQKSTLILGALGVVYGDIGTSPLYALRECFYGNHAINPNADNVLGVLSLILWSLILLVSVKYIGFVLRADNKGEGGILAIMALAVPDRSNPTKKAMYLSALGLFGAGLLYGDGVITPSLTVLSAIEGLNVATNIFEPYIVSITSIILVLLFLFQRHGTGKMGAAFGPVMLLWFAVIAILGLANLWRSPEVFKAVNPWIGIHFLLTHGQVSLSVLGAVFLAVTGAEALYADMGHFGRNPIRQAWLMIVLPSLVLNYLGQGALLLKDPSVAENPFYHMAPSWGRYPLVMIATFAAIIASQALISGAFSITMQAVQLGLLPRIPITHTSSRQKGQIYVAHTNWILMIICLALVAEFRESTRLASAYGIAVTLTMVITSVLFCVAARRLWKWSLLKCTAFLGIFLLIEISFALANLLKIANGGWVPLVLAAAIFIVMTTWQMGRKALRYRLNKTILPLTEFMESLEHRPVATVSGTAVFMTGNPEGTPIALLHNLKHNKVLHQLTVILNIQISDQSHVNTEETLSVEKLNDRFYRVTGLYGFMDQPDIPELLECCQEKGLKINLDKTTYFLSSETIVPGRHSVLSEWRQRLFTLLSRNAQRATAFFRLPPNRVVELGIQVEV